MPTFTSRQFEEYPTLSLYSIDLDEAQQAARMLRRYRRTDIRYCILRDVIVSYSRPFSGNRGKLLTKHSLPEKIVPRAQRPLHRELFKLRNQAFAHTDHSFRDPRLAAFPKAEGGARFVMSFSNPPWESLNRRASEIEALIAAVENAVKDWMEAFHVRVEPLFPPQLMTEGQPR